MHLFLHATQRSFIFCVLLRNSAALFEVAQNKAFSIRPAPDCVKRLMTRMGVSLGLICVGCASFAVVVAHRLRGWLQADAEIGYADNSVRNGYTA
jgi:hypothetical protein